MCLRVPNMPASYSLLSIAVHCWLRRRLLVVLESLELVAEGFLFLLAEDDTRSIFQPETSLSIARSLSRFTFS